MTKQMDKFTAINKYLSINWSNFIKIQNNKRLDMHYLFTDHEIYPRFIVHQEHKHNPYHQIHLGSVVDPGAEH